ncbi:Monooxygenase, FAD-binding protein [Actinidia chinensis var. chinensis]|uniref:Monooxygenase, FAD-binding protein n=1 Tax=Actinidia chinensis var. chinensis TaxID=1590841 RepID=A0A2R6QIA4_ACTCC|nr:Monooxygenase, FAD-binding protein [Actinidia chinensis var. chinensis]
MDVNKLMDLVPRTRGFISDLEPKVGQLEHMSRERVFGDIISIVHDCRRISDDAVSRESEHIQLSEPYKYPATGKPKVAVVGSGPSGLFAYLVLAELGADVTLIKRGQAVEQRGRDIGALVVRNLKAIFSLGRAGTWSDGKLVTRIGRNSSNVLVVRIISPTKF